jgi:hypothetical protein
MHHHTQLNLFLMGQHVFYAEGYRREGAGTGIKAERLLFPGDSHQLAVVNAFVYDYI